MTSYYRISLAARARLAAEAMAGSWIGVGWMPDRDLTGQFSSSNAEFRKRFNPILMEQYGMESRVAAGLASGMTYTVCKAMVEGDVVLSRTESGDFQVGRVAGDYYFVPGHELPHRRPVEWSTTIVSKESVSDELKRTLQSIGTVQAITGYPPEIQSAYEAEIESMLANGAVPAAETERLDDNVSFVMEKYLEEFLIANWIRTPFGEEFDLVDSQVQTDTGPLDILARSKDGRSLVVLELKLGRASDAVVGQVLRYMGFVQSELCEPGQTVRGIIVGSDHDRRIRWALSMTQGIDFYRYEIGFSLHREISS